MCGRYSLAAARDELVEVFGVPDLAFDWAPRYNVAPGQLAPVVGEDRRGRRMGLLRWGFLPADADKPGSGRINARAETAARARSFREAFAHRRCLVPADGFYEWRTEAGTKVPRWFHPVGGGLLALAAIWEHWELPGHEPRDGFAILTVDANADVRGVHHRMPLIVAPEDRALWLTQHADPARLRRLVRSAPDGALDARVVSTRVNSARVDDSDLLTEV